MIGRPTPCSHFRGPCGCSRGCAFCRTKTEGSSKRTFVLYLVFTVLMFSFQKNAARHAQNHLDIITQIHAASDAALPSVLAHMGTPGGRSEVRKDIRFSLIDSLPTKVFIFSKYAPSQTCAANRCFKRTGKHISHSSLPLIPVNLYIPF